MREFELIIDEAFKKGLSPLYTPPTNSQYFWECLGFRVGKEGLDAYKPLDDPLSYLAPDMVWPFPQVITGDGYAVLVVRDALTGYDTAYSISEDHETVTELFTSMPVVHDATLLEAADFGKYIFMTNGASMGCSISLSIIYGFVLL